MRKGKLGLQKEVSKIFTGIQIPKKDGVASEARSTMPTKPAPSVVQHTYVAPPASVTPSVPVDQPPVPPVLTQAAPAPASVAETPAAAPAKPVPPKPAAVTPKPFMIPEPTASHDERSSKSGPAHSAVQQPRQVVYEPPKPRQTYEPPAPPASTPASRQSKPELVIRQPKDSPLFKIIENVKGKLLSGAKSGKQKAMLLIIPVLAIILLLAVFNAVKKTHRTAVAPAKKAGAAIASDSRVNWELPPVIPSNLRDPMLFGTISVTTAGKDSAQGPLVKGIVYSDDNPCAVVGDRIVSAGDVVAGAKVEKINRDSVEFSMGDKKWTQKVER